MFFGLFCWQKKSGCQQPPQRGAFWRLLRYIKTLYKNIGQQSHFRPGAGNSFTSYHLHIAEILNLI